MLERGQFHYKKGTIKDENKDGETLQVSQLADWIENKGSVNPSNSDWTTSLN